MIEDIQSCCEKLSILFTEKICKELFGTQSDNIWKSVWMSCGNDFSKFIKSLSGDQKIILNTWIKKNNKEILKDYEFKINIGENKDKIKSKLCMNLFKTIFHKDHQTNWSLWIKVAKYDITKFINIISAADYLQLSLWASLYLDTYVPVPDNPIGNVVVGNPRRSIDRSNRSLPVQNIVTPSRARRGTMISASNVIGNTAPPIIIITPPAPIVTEVQNVPSNVPITSRRNIVVQAIKPIALPRRNTTFKIR